MREVPSVETLPEVVTGVPSTVQVAVALSANGGSE